MGRKILVVVAHPDDEALGCGGAIARHAAQGDKVDIVFLADGTSARRNPAEPLSARRKSAESSCRILGANSLQFGDFPDNKLDSIPLLEIVQILETMTTEMRPDLIYTHSAGDLNIDHQIVHRAVLTAFRPIPSSSLSAILGIEVLSSTGWSGPHPENLFKPNYYVDISCFLEKKIEGLRPYEIEMRQFPHPRSYEGVRALAQWRGISVGVPAAEAFEIIRWIER